MTEYKELMEEDWGLTDTEYENQSALVALDWFYSHSQLNSFQVMSHYAQFPNIVKVIANMSQADLSAWANLRSLKDKNKPVQDFITAAEKIQAECREMLKLPAPKEKIN
jgi:hypothetical protein